RKAETALTAAAIAAIIVQASRDQYHATGHPCACPDDTMRNGRACGGRSAYSRPGGGAPLCYPHDITTAMIEDCSSNMTHNTRKEKKWTRKYPSEQRNNLVAQFHSILQRRQEEEDLTFDRAFSRVSLEVLGYDLDAGTMSDGRGDFGIDFWIVEERAATLFQF